MTSYLHEPAAHVPLYESVASKLRQEMRGIARQSSSLRNKFVFVLILSSISVHVNGKKHYVISRVKRTFINCMGNVRRCGAFNNYPIKSPTLPLQPFLLQKMRVMSL